MKKLSIILCLAFMWCIKAEAQISQQYTIWNQNHYLINPAAAGNKSFWDIAVGYRKQWAGVSNSPSSFYGTAHGALNQPKKFQRSALATSRTSSGVYSKKGKAVKLKHAVGVSLNNAENGAFKRTDLQLTYALHLPIYNDIYLSFGLSAGMGNYGFDQDKANVLISGDPTYNAYSTGSNSNQLNVDGGTYLYSDKFFFGYSAKQLLQNELGIAEGISGGGATLSIQHYLMGGYNFDLTNDFVLSPSVLYKKLGVEPASYDLNALLTFKQQIYVGLAYRSEDAISLLFGMQFNHILKAGYAYDFTTSEIKDQSSGSHEIFIGLTLF